MGNKIKIRPIGNSFGIIIPKAILEHYNLKSGDIIELDNKGKKISFNLTEADNDKDKTRKKWRSQKRYEIK